MRLGRFKRPFFTGRGGEGRMAKPTDNLSLNNGRKPVKGTIGDDIIHGTDGRDHIIGYEGDDQLYGHGGDDILEGGAGFNYLYGGSGNDTLIGGNDGNVFSTVFFSMI